MRIVFLCRSFPWHRQGGLEWHAWDLARGMAREKGHSLRLLTTPAAADPRKSARLRREFFESQGAGPEEAARLEVIELGRAREGLYSPSYLLGARREVLALARRRAVDVIHAQGFAALALPARRALRLPLLLTIHGTLWSETWMDPRARRFLAPRERLALPWRYRHRLACWPLYLRMLHRADRLAVDSEFTRRELERDHPALRERIEIAPLGVAPERFPLVERQAPDGAEGRNIRLLLLGRLERAKGFHIALRALALCRHKNWTLDVAGEGPERHPLEQLARALRIEGRVRFSGRVPAGRLAELYARADLFLNPELTQPAFGLVSLEAMLQGVAVLASRAGALPEVLGREGGWLVDPGEPAAWAGAIERLLADPARLRAQGERARRSALERFSLPAMLAAYETIYRQLVCGKNSKRPCD